MISCTCSPPRPRPSSASCGGRGGTFSSSLISRARKATNSNQKFLKSLLFKTYFTPTHQVRPEEGDPASDEESADAGVQLLVVREQPFGDEGNRANRELKNRRFMRECNCWWTNFKHVESQFFVRKNFVAGKNLCQVFMDEMCSTYTVCIAIKFHYSELFSFIFFFDNSMCHIHVRICIERHTLFAPRCLPLPRAAWCPSWCSPPCTRPRRRRGRPSCRSGRRGSGKGRTSRRPGTLGFRAKKRIYIVYGESSNFLGNKPNIESVGKEKLLTVSDDQAEIDFSVSLLFREKARDMTRK